MSAGTIAATSLLSPSSHDARLLLDGLTDYAVVMLDPSGLVTTWNLGAERIIGYAASEIVGRHLSSFYVAEDVDENKPREALRVAREAGRVEEEGWRRRKDGSRFWASAITTALRGPDGDLHGFAHVTRDLSQKRGVEEELRRAEQRFHDLVDAVADYAIFMLDPAGNVATWNVGAHRIKGYEASEIIGNHFSRFYTSADRAAGRPDAILESVRREGRFEEEGWRVRKDGTRFWANVVITILRDESGTLLGFAKVTRDLSERRRAREDLHRSEERFRLLVESVEDCAIYMLDPSGIITTWNAGAEKIKGYSHGEIVGQHFSRFFTPEQRESGAAERELELAATNGRFQEEGWRVRKDGSRFWANVVVTAIRDAGVLVGFAKVTRDLTAFREAEAASAAAREVEEDSRIKDEFLATVSHELRTPLNAIYGWSSLLRQRTKDPALLKGIDIIFRNAEAQGKLVDDILDVSRIITGKLRLELKRVELKTIVREAIQVVRPSAKAKQITISFRVPKRACRLVADGERVRQVCWNLLSNAVKFTPEGGTIRVGIKRDRAENRFRVSVADTGVGIAPEFLPYVFDRFKQADGSTTRRVGGLGLGLSIVKHIVTLHGGQVEAASEGAGKGSVFTISLPARAAVPAVHEPDKALVPRRVTPSSGPTGAPLHGVRVLLVDDDDDARELIVTLLDGWGASVDTASSAAAAYSLVQEVRPDVLISDIAMPDEDGYMLMRRVRALAASHGGETPALALTAHAREADLDKARAVGFTSHVGKPVKPDDLLSAVEELARPSPRPARKRELPRAAAPASRS